MAISAYPGSAFVLDGSLWFVLDQGALGVLACDGEVQRHFTPEALAGAKSAKPKTVGLLRLLAAVEGALIDFNASGLSAAEFDALEERAGNVAYLLDNFREGQEE